jgi:hypothetical protein
MKYLVLFIALFIFSETIVFSGNDNKHQTIVNNSVLVPKSIFLQSGNINSLIRTDGYFNYDKVTFTSGIAGFIWPAASTQRLTTIFATGLYIGAKVVLSPSQKELRLAASFYNTHYSPGNIPVNGQVPPLSVCNDTAFNGYLVSVTDQSLVNGGVRTKNAAGRTYTFNYSPWSAWPVNLGAPYVEVNGIPGYQPGWNSDRPGIGFGTARPSEMIFTVFMDYTNCTNNIHFSELSLPGGSLPLGAEIQQLAYTFDADGFRNSYFVRYKIINKSGKNWDSTYIGLVNDADLGEAHDDVVGCDSSGNFAMTYNFDNNDAEYGSAPPAVGYTILQGPVVNTGINTDTAKFPCNTLIGYKMINMTGHNSFINGGDSCTGDPDDYIAAYNYMKGLSGCGQVIINPQTGNPTKYKYSGYHCPGGWTDNNPGDKRNVINCGPFNMNSGDTQVVVYAFQVSRSATNIASACALAEDLNSIKYYYYNCFNLIGIEPVGTIIPASFSLEQNYPNPFNPVTNIQFGIPKLSDVKLIVYDALGREVKLLVDQQLEPGKYNIDWNAGEQPSGVYFYRLIANQYSETRKMILVK